MARWAREAGAAGATFALDYGLLSVCPLGIVAHRTRLSACAGLGGRAACRWLRFYLAYQKEQTIFNATVEARLRPRLVGPIFAEAGLGLVVPLLRRGFYYNDLQGAAHDVFQVAALGGLLDAALGVELP